jgi:hypothetical protein
MSRLRYRRCCYRPRRVHGRDPADTNSPSDLEPGRAMVTVNTDRLADAHPEETEPQASTLPGSPCDTV